MLESSFRRERGAPGLQRHGYQAGGPGGSGADEGEVNAVVGDRVTREPPGPD